MKKLLVIIFISLFVYDIYAQCIYNITSTIPYDGEYASGKYSIYPGTGKNCYNIDKPIIIVEGFDPFDRMNNSRIYGQINYSTGFADNLWLNGYDLIILDFDNGSDFIQRNAYLLEELIDEVNNNIKVGSEPIVVMGLSMGGLVARYALADMENRGIDHETRLFISFDSPQNGANVPVGVQYMAKHVAEAEIAGIPILDGVEELQAAIGMLNSPAARQMLAVQTVDVRVWIDWLGIPHMETTDNNIVHDEFMAEIKNLGYPQQSRNIAICNGSINSTEQNFTPGQQLLRVFGINEILIPLSFSTFYVDLDLNYFADFLVNALPGDGQQHTIYSGGVFVIIGGSPVWVLDPKSVSSSHPPFDSSPGGIYDIKTVFDPASLPIEIELASEEFCFVPSVNALDLALASGEGLYHNISTDNLIWIKTPFDGFFGPFDKNEDHVEFTIDNSNYLLNEIYNPKPKSFCSSLYGEDIPVNLNLNTYDNSDRYIAQNNINIAGGSSFIIPAGKHVEMYAGNEVVLNGGFQVNTGSEFVVETIPDCFTSIATSGFKSIVKEEYSYSTDKEYNQDVIKIYDKQVNKYVEDLKNRMTTENLFQLYPNPASDKVFISNSFKGTAEISIFDMLGEQIYTGQFEENESIEINLSDFISGVYLIRVKSNNINYTKNLVVN